MEKLPISDLSKTYTHSTKRIILLDYDGTLVPLKPHPNEAVPGKEVKNILANLANNPRNQVVVISGREKESLDLWLSGLNLILVAEHGGFFKEPGEAWQTFFSEPTEWKAKLIPPLTTLVFSHEGSFIEEKRYSISWHYRQIEEKVQPEIDQILAAFRALPFSNEFLIVDEDCTLEFRTHGINKGKFVSRWLGRFHFDFLLAIGDGETDEDIFSLIDKPHYSVRVGKSISSNARYYVEEQSEIISVLRILTELPGNQPPKWFLN